MLEIDFCYLECSLKEPPLKQLTFPFHPKPDEASKGKRDCNMSPDLVPKVGDGLFRLNLYQPLTCLQSSVI